MTKVSMKIADILCQKELIDEEEKEIYAFGYEVIIDNVFKVLAILIAGAILNKTSVTVVFLLTFVVLRGYTGGYHAKSRPMCSLVSVVLWLGVVLGTESMAGVLKENEMLIIFMVLVSELIIYQYAPVENVNKRLTEEKRLRNRRYALILGSVYGILVLPLMFIHTSWGIAMALTMLEVAILMIIPSEGRINREEAEYLNENR